MGDTVLKLALPSKGALEQPSLDFLAAAGMKVYKPNRRQYSACIESFPNVTVLFQRASDILPKVAEGSADIGITGLDVVSEGRDNHEPVVVIEKLGFGRCELVVAVPDSWVDVSTLADLADLSLAIKATGRDMRIVTKYPNLTRDWFYSKGIVNFALVDADGALEAAPAMGYADLIVDLTETGTTLRENRLKTIEQGTLLRSEACLIGNANVLLNNPKKLEITRHVLELIEAHTRAHKFVSVVANVKGASLEDVGQKLVEQPALSGLIGPGLTRIHPRDATGAWYEVNMLVERSLLLDVVEHLRELDGTGISVYSPDYVFDSACHIYDRLRRSLESAKQRLK
ncbi:MAG: ATP phosphoribosyltransferase [Aggregatilineales bacterium]